MVDVQTDIIINRSLHAVADYAIDPGNAPEWYVNIKSAEWLTSPPLAVGSHIAFKAAFLVKQLSYTYQIAELIPDQKLVMRTVNGPFPMETTYTFERIADNATKMTLYNRGNPSGFSKLFAPFMEMMMRKANKKDLKKLKEILEAIQI